MTNTDNDLDKKLGDDYDDHIQKANERFISLNMALRNTFYGAKIYNPFYHLTGGNRTSIPESFQLPENNDESDLSKKIEILAESMFYLQEKYDVLVRQNRINDRLLMEGLSTINQLEEEHKKLNEKFYSYVDNRENDLSIQYLNTEIYLDTDNPDDIFKVYTAVLDFLDDIDFKVFVELEAVKGSWWKKFISKSSGALTSEDVTSRLKEAEYALEVQILKAQSEVDKNQSEALTNIMVSLKDVPNAAIRIGSLLVVKVTNEESVVSLNVQTLNLTQLHYLNKNPNLLNQPRNIWDQLSKENDDDNLQLNN